MSNNLIAEYRNDIKLIRRQINKINKKKKNIKNKKKVIVVDERTAEDIKDLSILGEMLSSTHYALWWLEHGYEKPYSLEDIFKQNKDSRTQLWGDMDEAIQYHDLKAQFLKSQRELAFNDYLKKEEKDEKKQEQLVQVKEILSILSPLEREYFLLKHEAVLTEAECAEELDLKKGTVKSMAQRIRNKIDRYFNGSTQMDLFNFLDDE